VSALLDEPGSAAFPTTPQVHDQVPLWEEATRQRNTIGHRNSAPHARVPRILCIPQLVERRFGRVPLRRLVPSGVPYTIFVTSTN